MCGAVLRAQLLRDTMAISRISLFLSHVIYDTNLRRSNSTRTLNSLARKSHHYILPNEQGTAPISPAFDSPSRICIDKVIKLRHCQCVCKGFTAVTFRKILSMNRTLRGVPESYSSIYSSTFHARCPKFVRVEVIRAFINPVFTALRVVIARLIVE
jgi:hypothetical protein